MNKEEILKQFDKSIENYENHYLKVTKQDEDFKGLVGPAEKFDEMADWQFNLLKNQGMTASVSNDHKNAYVIEKVEKPENATKIQLI